MCAMACDLHDYVEIVCMFHYEVQLSMKNGERMTGVAIDTVRNEDKQECIIIGQSGDLSSGRKLVLTDIAHMKVLTPGARFEEVVFT